MPRSAAPKKYGLAAGTAAAIELQHFTVQRVAAAGTHDDDLIGLIELRRSALGDDLELGQSVERRHFALTALQFDFLVGDTIKGKADVAIRVALVGAKGQRHTANGDLILRGDVLNAGHKIDETENADVTVEGSVLDGCAVDDETDGRGLGLDDGFFTRHGHGLLVRADGEPGIDLRHLIDGKREVVLLEGLRNQSCRL